tara:strand:- start:148 stop:336 length:189 start_codon:yes stop_codon:yes gene_type:complete
MSSKITNKVLIFLNSELGLTYSSIHLGVKLSMINNTSLPMALWSHSLITTDELDRFYDFLWS